MNQRRLFYQGRAKSVKIDGNLLSFKILEKRQNISRRGVINNQCYNPITSAF